jgi:hypothetical protein
MYYLYEVINEPPQRHFTRLEKTHLFGCNVGKIHQMLSQQLCGTENEPYSWHLPVEELLVPAKQALIIDLKPNNKEPNTVLSLYEVRDVWGYSAFGWTPGMMRLRGVSIDGEPPISDAEDFAVEPIPGNDSVYTFLHFDGTIRAGKLEGKWTAPRRSSTNSALLWPNAIEYFIKQIRETTPRVFEPQAI